MKGKKISNNAPKHYHLLIVGLYYPAILGYLFYCIVDELTGVDFTLNSFILIVAYIGIVATFSVDFLYSYASKQHYTIQFFIADLAILILLFLASRSLLRGIMEDVDIWLFFTSYIAIHAIFLVWDLVLVERHLRRAIVVKYDVSGLIISVIGLLFFRESTLAAIIILWLCTIVYLLVGWKTIFKMVEN